MLEQCIHSFIDGRVRLRHEALRSEALGALVQQYLQSVDGVTRVDINSRNGSLLLEYDTEKLTKDNLLEMLHKGERLLGNFFPDTGNDTAHDAALTFPAPHPRRPRLTPAQWRRLGNHALLGVLAITTLLGLLGRSGAHTTTSLIFAALCGEHVYRRRKQL